MTKSTIENNTLSLGNETMKERDEHTDNLLKAIYYSIATLFPDADKPQCLELIKACYTDYHRSFHTLQHIYQILPPDLQKLIAEGNFNKITNDQMQKIISATFHDVNYSIDTPQKDHDGKIFAIQDIRDALGESHDKAIQTKFRNIRANLQEQGYRDQDISILMKLFDIKDDTIFTTRDFKSPHRLDGAPMNEFLSALNAIKYLAPNGIAKLSDDAKHFLLQTIIDLQMTVPFQKEHAEHLLKNAAEIIQYFDMGISNKENYNPRSSKNIAALSRDYLIGMINHAVDMSNRDIGNFLHPNFVMMMNGDWAIAQEHRISPLDDKSSVQKKSNSNIPLQDLFKALTGTFFPDIMLRNLLKNDSLVQARINSEGVRDETVGGYENSKEIALKNIESTIINAYAMGASLGILYLKPEVIKSQFPAPDPSQAATHTPNGKRIIEALESGKSELPKELNEALTFLLNNYSIEQLKEIKKTTETALAKQENIKEGVDLTKGFDANAILFNKPIIIEQEITIKMLWEERQDIHAQIDKLENDASSTAEDLLPLENKLIENMKEIAKQQKLLQELATTKDPNEITWARSTVTDQAAQIPTFSITETDDDKQKKTTLPPQNPAALTITENPTRKRLPSLPLELQQEIEQAGQALEAHNASPIPKGPDDFRTALKNLKHVEVREKEQQKKENTSGIDSSSIDPQGVINKFQNMINAQHNSTKQH